jgi:hypothetical protein
VLDYRRVKLAGMIKQLGMSKWRISRCVRQLRDKGYVEAGELDGAIRTYRLSTGVGILPECEVANLRQALAEVEAKARELASRRLGQHQWDLFTVAEMAKWAVRASEIRKAAAMRIEEAIGCDLWDRSGARWRDEVAELETTRRLQSGFRANKNATKALRFKDAIIARFATNCRSVALPCT